MWLVHYGIAAAVANFADPSEVGGLALGKPAKICSLHASAHGRGVH